MSRKIGLRSKYEKKEKRNHASLKINRVYSFRTKRGKNLLLFLSIRRNDTDISDN
jgi:hypothetical protein